MSELTALIFDVDGTLAETERDAHRVAFNDTFAAYQLDWHWSDTLYGELLAVTGGKERMQFYLDQYRPDYPRPAHLTEFIAELHQDKTRRYNTLIAQQQIPLRPGIQRLLAQARQMSLRLAIATTTSYQNVATLLENSLAPDAMSWFEVVAAGDVVTAKKPAADIYHYALKALNLNANHCLAVEDSANGLKAALGAQLCTVITVNDYTQHEDFSGACLVVNHLGEPDQPLAVLHGNIGNAHYVDVAVLQQLMEHR